MQKFYYYSPTSKEFKKHRFNALLELILSSLVFLGSIILLELIHLPVSLTMSIPFFLAILTWRIIARLTGTFMFEGVPLPKFISIKNRSYLNKSRIWKQDKTFKDFYKDVIAAFVMSFLVFVLSTIVH